MNEKDYRGARRDVPRKMPLARGTTAFAVLEHVYNAAALVRMTDLHQFMPPKKQNTSKVREYIKRLIDLAYVEVNHKDEVRITAVGINWMESGEEEADEPEAPKVKAAKYVGKPAQPRECNIWTKALNGYESKIRANWRLA